MYNEHIVTSLYKLQLAQENLHKLELVQIVPTVEVVTLAVSHYLFLQFVTLQLQ